MLCEFNFLLATLNSIYWIPTELHMYLSKHATSSHLNGVLIMECIRGMIDGKRLHSIDIGFQLVSAFIGRRTEFQKVARSE